MKEHEKEGEKVNFVKAPRIVGEGERNLSRRERHKSRAKINNLKI